MHGLDNKGEMVNNERAAASNGLSCSMGMELKRAGKSESVREVKKKQTDGRQEIRPFYTFSRTAIFGSCKLGHACVFHMHISFSMLITERFR